MGCLLCIASMVGILVVQSFVDVPDWWVITPYVILVSYEAIYHLSIFNSSKSKKLQWLMHLNMRDYDDIRHIQRRGR